MTLPMPGIWFGIILMGHSLYRIANYNRFQAACPYCQTIKHQMLKNGRSFKCKSCGHRLGIFEEKLADMSYAPSDVRQASAVNVSPAGIHHPDQEYIVTVVKRHRAAEAVGTIIVLGLLIWWLSGGGENTINNHIADNLSQQYDIAKRQGNQIDMCVQAGAAALSFLNAKDEKSYAYWKSVEDTDCKTAGLR